MPAGIEIYNYVTNQKGSPALWSDLLAARPPAGFIGRLFVSTDTFEIYRDNGITWDLISGGGGPSVNIYNSDGTLTGTRVVTMAGQNLTFEGGASTARIAMSANNNVPRIFSFRTAGLPRWAFRIDGNETGLNVGADFALRAYNDLGVFTFSPLSVERRTGEKSFIANETLTTAAANLTGVYNLTTATMGAGVSLTGGNPQAASHNNYTVVNDGSYTVADSIFFGAQSNVLRLTSAANGTATFTQTGNISSAAANLNQVQYDTSNGSAITYTHVAVGQNLGIYRLSGAGSLAITNGYGQLINDLNEYGNANLTITNRWGIYQNSLTDVNYLGGTTLVGTPTNSGFKFDISGSFRNTTSAYLATASGNVGVGTITPGAKVDIIGNLRTTQDITVFGISIGRGNGSIIENTRCGLLALNSNTTGVRNSAFGANALFSVTTGVFNSAFGYDALGLNISGNSNTAFGQSALYTNTGNVNVGVGLNALYNNTTGIQNTAIGSNSGRGTGPLFVNANTTGNNNTFLGFETTGVSPTDSNRTWIGNTFTTSTWIAGNLLLGLTTDGGQRIQIDSSMRLIPTTTVPTATAGTLYYDSATNKLKLHDGTSFVNLN